MVTTTWPVITVTIPPPVPLTVIIDASMDLDNIASAHFMVPRIESTPSMEAELKLVHSSASYLSFTFQSLFSFLFSCFKK